MDPEQEYPPKPLFSKRRLLLGVALVLSLLVLVGATLIINSQPSVARANSSNNGTRSRNSVGCCGRLGIALSDKLQKKTSVSVAGTWSCRLPRGAKIQFAEIIVSLSQRNGNLITRASTASSISHKCNGLVKIFHELVNSPRGSRPFHTGKAHVTATLSIGYFLSSSSYYDLLVLNVIAPDVAVTITH